MFDPYIVNPEEQSDQGFHFLAFHHYSKTCLKRPLKIDITKVLVENGSLMKVESKAECSLGAFCNTFDPH